jgi:LAS superfamily LD-carboxypeptidase LdcB
VKGGTVDSKTWSQENQAQDYWFVLYADINTEQRTTYSADVIPLSMG